ncbi:restriction endonuclease subunit S [Streptomyces vastus]|uniref:Type I restriction modification DNA specificity domain-containing protein n=1 Tax=Streptomyces vastus TaxID=285451 RepID=A0ABN3RYY9_9ACTN
MREIRLGDVVSRVATRNSVGNENVLTISAAHGLVNQREFFNRRVASTDLSQYYLLERGDFAYNKSYSDGWPVGVVRQLERYDSGVVSPLYICFRPNRDAVCPEFLQHYFDSGVLDDAIQAIAKEGVRNHGLLNVRVADFFSLKLTLPPLEEQRRIAEILDSVERDIDRVSREFTKMDSVYSSTFVNSLSQSRGVLRRHEVSRIGDLAGSMVGDFRFARLGDFLDSIDAGMSPDLEGSPAGLGEWAFLKVSAVGRANFRAEENKRADDPDLFDPSIEVHEGDLLITRANTPDLVGATCVVDVNRPRLMLSDKTLRLNLVGDQALPEYLCEVLRLPELRVQIEVAATGTSGSMKNISQKSIRNLVVPWYDVTEQRRIVQPLTERRETRRRARAEMDKLHSIKRALAETLMMNRECVA